MTPICPCCDSTDLVAKTEMYEYQGKPFALNVNECRVCKESFQCDDELLSDEESADLLAKLERGEF